MIPHPCLGTPFDESSVPITETPAADAIDERLSRIEGRLDALDSGFLAGAPAATPAAGRMPDPPRRPIGRLVKIVRVVDVTELGRAGGRARAANLSSEELAAGASLAANARWEAKKKNPAAVLLGALGGKKGGKARAEAMTPEERSASASKAAQARTDKLSPKRRSEIARKASQARWGKKGGKA